MKRRFILTRRHGSMMILMVLAIPTLLLIVGFSVDLAQMQRTRTELRSVTDVAANADCVKLEDTGDLSLAMATGQEIASANRVD